MSQPMIGPIQDPYQKAAQLALTDRADVAWDAVKDSVRERALEDYAPEQEADEDGQWMDYRGPARRAVEREIQIASEHVSDAIWEILMQDGSFDDDAAQAKANELGTQLDALWAKNVDDLVEDIIDDHKDGAAYSRNPNAYYGVSDKDFL